MKNFQLRSYITGWALYLLFAFLLYPQLRITVMLFSIPLTMLGGWVMLYRGAILTTALTIPVHFLLLTIYSDDPKVIMEAFNPFGIGSQLIFSLSTALLHASQLEYRRLNNSLEELVIERTEDLEKLTHYLIDAQQMENRELNASLLEKPMQDLKEILATSQLLKQKLQQTNHPRTNDADGIASIIIACINQLKEMDQDAIHSLAVDEDIGITLSNLKQQIEELHTLEVEIVEHPAWKEIHSDKTGYLTEIIFEAVSNALRHANPETIRIGIEQTENHLSIFIENDGKPYSPSVKEGMGLPLMRYRASKIGAELSIEPSQTQSTRVTCRIPTDA